MKNTRDIIKIILYLAIMAFLFLLPVKNQYIKQFFLIADIILSVLIIRAIYSLLLKPYMKLWLKNAKDFLKNSGSHIRNFLKPLLDRVRNQRRRYIKGTDDQKIIFNFNIAQKIKANLTFKKKLVYKNNISNTEKIRFFYIKFILTLIKNNYNIKYSYTPKEIKEIFNCKESGVLFSAYEEIRYGDGNTVNVSDELVELCKDSIENQ